MSFFFHVVCLIVTIPDTFHLSHFGTHMRPIHIYEYVTYNKQHQCVACNPSISHRFFYFVSFFLLFHDTTFISRTILNGITHTHTWQYSFFIYNIKILCTLLSTHKDVLSCFVGGDRHHQHRCCQPVVCGCDFWLRGQKKKNNIRMHNNIIIWWYDRETSRSDIYVFSCANRMKKLEWVTMSCLGAAVTRTPTI